MKNSDKSLPLDAFDLIYGIGNVGREDDGLAGRLLMPLRRKSSPMPSWFVTINSSLKMWI